jgi:Protein kinase domain/Tetratricopeptide repeat
MVKAAASGETAGETTRLSPARARSSCLDDDEMLLYLTCADGAAGDARTGHVITCPACLQAVTALVRGGGSGRNGGGSAALQTLFEGQTLLGRYEVKRFIARGGMGEVYAVHDRHLDETVALKTLTCTLLDVPTALDRLKAEVVLARRVSHRNVCRILEFGLYDLGGRPSASPPLPFLTMEFLRGETLAQRLNRVGRLPEATVRDLAAQLCAGLEAIHEAGIVHRDLKPGNVLLIDENGGERAVITDFGLARATGTERSPDSASGRTLLGTLDYMAPEQLARQPPTPAFDVYAWGTVVYEMLTGRLPFDGPTPVSAALARRHQKPAAPSALVPGLDSRWDRLVTRCLAYRPSDRFTSVADLSAALAGGGVKPKAPWALPLGLGMATLALTMTARLAARPPTPPRPGSAMPMPAAAPPAAAVAAPVVGPPLPGPTRRPTARRHVRGPTTSLPPPSDGVGSLLAQARALLDDGNAAPACVLGEQVAAGAPALAEAHLLLGQCYVRLGRGEAARDHYRRYLELAPGATDAVFVRAIIDDRP